MPNYIIHSTALVDDDVILQQGVEIGPYSIIKGPSTIGEGTKIHSHVVIYSDVTIGKNCEIFPFAVIGGTPQDLKYKQERSTVTIGNSTVIREHVTIHKGTSGGIMKTSIGENCLIMGSCHVAHDCDIGENCIIAHNAVIGGHVKIGANSVIGGLAAIHQYVRIGNNAIVGGGSLVGRDIIPYGNVYGVRSTLKGINIVGMKRKNLPNTDISTILELYKFLFKPTDNDPKYFNKRLEIAEKSDYGSLGDEIIKFIREKSPRSICIDTGNSIEG